MGTTWSIWKRSARRPATQVERQLDPRVNGGVRVSLATEQVPCTANGCQKKAQLCFLKNVLRVRVWFKKVVAIDVPIVNMDQMPQKQNKINSQKSLTIWDQDTAVKENHQLTRQRITCLTILSSQEDPVPWYSKGRCLSLEQAKVAYCVTTLWWHPKAVTGWWKKIKLLSNYITQD